MSKPGFVTSRYWRETDARAALDALAKSGLTLRAFAIREGIDEHRLVRWRRTLEERHSRAQLAKQLPFIEVRRSAPAQVEVVLRSSRVFRFASDLEPSVLRRLVEALEDVPAC